MGDGNFQKCINLLNELLKPCDCKNASPRSENSSTNPEKNLAQITEALEKANKERDDAKNELAACIAEKNKLSSKNESITSGTNKTPLDKINGTATNIDTLLSFLDKTDISEHIKVKLERVKEVLNTKITTVTKEEAKSP